jgi:hypothetical protein
MTELKLHPRFNILVASNGSIVQNPDTGHVYSFFETSNGYLRVGFTHRKNGLNIKEKELVHRLVAETYLTKKLGKKEVDHMDRNRQNNDVSNLRWTSHKQNIRNSAVYIHGRYAKTKRKTVSIT